MHRELRPRHVTLQVLWKDMPPSILMAINIAGSAIFTAAGKAGCRLPCGRRIWVAASCSFNMPATRSANFVEFLISCGLWASARVIAYTIRMNNFPLIRTEFFVVQRRSLAVIDAWYLSFQTSGYFWSRPCCIVPARRCRTRAQF